MILIFSKRKNKRKILSFIGLVLIITQLMGCFGPSNWEIVEKFSDFITMFPTEDLSVLYDKNADKYGYSYGDLGTWVVSSHLHTGTEGDRKSVSVVLAFNRNTRQSKGNFHISTRKDGQEVKDAYRIYYAEDGLHLVDENVDEAVKEELANFNIMFNFISVKDRTYLDGLKKEIIAYNYNVPMYRAKYKLTPDDINVKKIKELYPDLPIEDDSITLELSGTGSPWYDKFGLELEISLDSSFDNRFSCSMSLRNSKEFDDFIEGKEK